MSVTYTSLYNRVISTANISNSTFTAAIPDALYAAQEEIMRAYTGDGLNRVLHVALDAGQYVLEKPVGWMQTVSMRYGVDSSIFFLDARTTEYCISYSEGNSSGLPKYYSNYDYNHWLISPSPGDEYELEFEIVCKIRPNPLNEENQTNWFTNNASGILFYRTMLELAPFIRDDERIAVWQSFYDRGLATLNGSPG